MTGNVRDDNLVTVPAPGLRQLGENADGHPSGGFGEDALGAGQQPHGFDVIAMLEQIGADDVLRRQPFAVRKQTGRGDDLRGKRFEGGDVGGEHRDREEARAEGARDEAVMHGSSTAPGKARVHAVEGGLHAPDVLFAEWKRVRGPVSLDGHEGERPARPGCGHAKTDQLAVPEEDKPDIREVLDALARLPLNQRAALVMRELEGRTYTEIADTLGVSVPAVETLIFRARRSLRLKASAIRSLAVVPLPSSLSQLFDAGGIVAGGGAVIGSGFLLKAAVAVVAGVVATGVSGDHVHKAASATRAAIEPFSRGANEQSLRPGVAGGVRAAGLAVAMRGSAKAEGLVATGHPAARSRGADWSPGSSSSAATTESGGSTGSSGSSSSAAATTGAVTDTVGSATSALPSAPAPSLPVQVPPLPQPPSVPLPPPPQPPPLPTLP